MMANKELQIGIQALTEIKRSKSPITTTQLASKIGTSVGFLGQILKKLRKSDLIYAKHGPGGGYTFNLQRKDLDAFDVAVALGYEFAPFVTRGSPVPADRLNGEIIDAFLRTKI